MRLPLAKRLEIRLIVTVGVGLLLFSAIAGFFTYDQAYRQQLAQAASLQRQLVHTVQAQAEVAAFAANREIARDVLEGLLANPVILAVRIEATEGFTAELQSHHTDFDAGNTYPLHSPVDRIERIGTLAVVQNDDEVNRAAARVAWFQTALMLTQVLAAVALLAAVLRFMLVDPITRLAQAMTTIQPGSAARLTIEDKHADDEIGLLAKGANTILDAAETAIAEARAQRNELERLATHDHLTGLPTLRLAQDRLQIACNHARRAERKVALLFIDLDGFKAVNDTHGHDAGDAVLCEIAQRLRACIRAEDTAARSGGDEFLVILGNLPDTQASSAVAANIGSALAGPIYTAGQTITLGASIGIAVFPDHTGNIDAMRDIADQAMYRVKRSGKGAYAFAAPTSAATLER